MEIKNKKIYYKPYNKVNDNMVVIMWDYKPIMKINAKGVEIETPLAVWQEHTFNYIPTLNEIKEIIISYYNSIIDKEILSEFTWKGMKVWLSIENQFNYKVIYDIAIQTEGKNLPVTLKFGDDENTIYYEFSDIDELSIFYRNMTDFIQTTIQNGWKKKEKINWDFYK
jgi:hypothetical protein